MKISVLGAGAIGSMLGGLIKHHDPQVELVMVGRGDHGKAIHEQGRVALEGPWGRRSAPVRLSFQVEDIAGSDYVLFTVKSQATREAIASARPYLGEARLISIQNGINGVVLSEYVPPERLVLGVTATNMAILKPGTVSLQLNAATLVGASPGENASEAVEGAAALLKTTGLRVEVHPNVQGVQYNKLAVNALGYASVLSASNFITEAILCREWRRAVGIPILEECLAAFEQAGIELAPIPRVPDVYRFRKLLTILDAPVLGAAVAFGAKTMFNRKPIVFSLYQDLVRGKVTEIDFVNGEIVRLSLKNGRQAPCNAKVVEMVRQLERRSNGGFFSREEVIGAFQDLAP